MPAISYMALNRLLEEKLATVASQPGKSKRNPDCVLSVGRTKSDDELLAKLHAFGFADFDRAQLDSLTRLHPSAQQLAFRLIETNPTPIPEVEKDWVWIAVVCLWERWFPDRSNFEQIDDHLDAGYKLYPQESSDRVLELWLPAWRNLQTLFAQFRFESLEEFDTQFAGLYSLKLWLQDFSGVISHLAETSAEHARLQLELCKFVLPRSLRRERDEALRDLFSTRFAESCALLGLDPGVEARSYRDAEFDSIIAALDKPYDGILPVAALRAAQANQPQIIPRLLELIRNSVTKLAAAPGEDPTDGALMAMLLLMEFDAVDAIPEIFEIFARPDFDSFRLFDDLLSELFPAFLARNATPEHLALLDGLIANREAETSLRWTAVNTHAYLVCLGKLSREEAAARLIAQLNTACDLKDANIAGPIVEELYTIAPPEAAEAIARAYQLDLVDRSLVREEDIAEAIRRGEPHYRGKLAKLSCESHGDTVEELSSWPSYSADRRPPHPNTLAPQASEYSNWDLDFSDDSPDTSTEPVGTIVNSQLRVGRNEPCPCGSGKKYKKCCGGRA